MKTRRRLGILTLALAAACAVPAFAGVSAIVAERPLHQFGERWVYRQNGTRYAIEFLRYEGDLIVTRRIKGGEVSLWYSSPDGNPLRAVRENGRPLIEHGGEPQRVKFPLRVGASWTAHYLQGGTVPRTINASVAAYEDIAVAAGTFKAFRIEIVNQRRERGLSPAYETLWYAPVVGRLLKHISSELNIDMELVEYLPPSPRISAR